MIAIDPHTGLELTGVAALSRRFERVLTTPVISRVKRRGVGNRALSFLGKMQNPSTAMIVQNLTLEAVARPINGLSEFNATRCIAKPSPTGFKVAVHGTWRGEPLILKGSV
ncbi:phage baseplate protein [Photobacterium swingsii]|uniref:phage baseplate protein n=1 Tax=Photobacterium swingsii TaxID=680026 RepID=UPI00352F11A3